MKFEFTDEFFGKFQSSLLCIDRIASLSNALSCLYLEIVRNRGMVLERESLEREVNSGGCFRINQCCKYHPRDQSDEPMEVAVLAWKLVAAVAA